MTTGFTGGPSNRFWQAPDSGSGADDREPDCAGVLGRFVLLPFGFSYLALHVSSLALGLVGLAFLYASVREMGGSRPMALFAALTLAVDPLYFDLANSFMTDVPFVALMAMRPTASSAA